MAEEAAASLDSLQVLVGSWELLTFTPRRIGDWVRPAGVRPADWSFGPASGGTPGGLAGVGQLTLTGEALPAQIDISPGTDDDPVLLTMTLGSDQVVRFVGSFHTGHQVVLIRDDTLAARVAEEAAVAMVARGAAGRVRRNVALPNEDVVRPEPSDRGAPPLPMLTGMRLVIEETDRFVLILQRDGAEGEPLEEYLMLEFRKHQTQ